MATAPSTMTTYSSARPPLMLNPPFDTLSGSKDPIGPRSRFQKPGRSGCVHSGSGRRLVLNRWFATDDGGFRLYQSDGRLHLDGFRPEPTESCRSTLRRLAELRAMPVCTVFLKPLCSALIY